MQYRSLLSLFILLMVASHGSSVFSEEPRGGQNSVFFQKFFVKQQPKEYYQFPKVRERLFAYNSKQVFLNYQVLEDFSKPNTWGIISPSEQFIDPKNNVTPTTDSDLLNWRTFQRSDVDYNLLPPVDRAKTIRQSLPSIMGIRSLFLNNGRKKIQVYPKEPLFIPAYENHYIELWVFGLKINYDVFVLLQDYKGMMHRVYLGDLKHYAWQRLRGELDSSKLGGINPSLVYTRAMETRLRVHAISFESIDNQTEGFFGTWIADLGVVFNPQVTIPDSLSSPAATLATSFDWDPNAPQRPTAQEDVANTPAGQ